MSKAEAIRQARAGLGLTQRQLAELLDVHPQTVSKWERGEREASRRLRRLLVYEYERRAGKGPEGEG